MKVLSLVGARPQIIKEAIICKELQKAGTGEILVNSDQHYNRNMSNIFLEALDIKVPDYNLDVAVQ